MSGAIRDNINVSIYSQLYLDCYTVHEKLAFWDWIELYRLDFVNI